MGSFVDLMETAKPAYAWHIWPLLRHHLFSAVRLAQASVSSSLDDHEGVHLAFYDPRRGWSGPTATSAPPPNFYAGKRAFWIFGHTLAHGGNIFRTPASYFLACH